MPGASPLLDEIDPTAVTAAPEGVKLWFLSQLPSDSCDKSCIAILPCLELNFQLTQAHDAFKVYTMCYLRRTKCMSQRHKGP